MIILPNGVCGSDMRIAASLTYRRVRFCVVRPRGGLPSPSAAVTRGGTAS